MWISAGIYPGAPSYTIWREGNNYFAKDENGYIASGFSGTNISLISQNCINALPLSSFHGGIILYKVGEYVFDSGISTGSKYGVQIVGEGWTSTVLDFSSVEGAAIKFGSVSGETYFHRMRDVRIKVGSSSNAVGVYLVRTYYANLENVRLTADLTGSNSTGIIVDGTTLTDVFCGYNTIFQPELQNFKIGILFNGTTSKNDIISGRVKGKTTIQSGSYGVYIDAKTGKYSDTVAVFGLAIEYYSVGLFIHEYAHDCSFTSLRLEQMGDGIVINGSYNFFHQTSFSQGSFTGLLIDDNGFGNVFRDSYDLPTERFGNVTVGASASSVWVEHSLYWGNASNIYIFAIPSWSTTIFVSGINTTHAQLNFGSTSGSDQFCLWFAEYRQQ